MRAGAWSIPNSTSKRRIQGHLLCQDTYFVRTIKGVGKIYQKTVIDAHCSHVFAKLYLSKVPMTAVDVLNDQVLPFYEEHNVEIEHLLTDNGREYCGRPVGHPSNYIGPSNRSSTGGSTSARQRPTASANGSIAPQRKSSTPCLPQDILRVTGTVAADLNHYLAFHNRERAHQGYRTRAVHHFRPFQRG
jgi:hypothetical protein